MPAKPSVLIVDDHPLTRDGVAALLAKSGCFAICGEAANGTEAREKTSTLKPDLIVMDLGLGGRDGAGLVADLLLAHPSARVLVFSSFDELLHAPRALRAGARGYVMKNAEPHVLEEALQAIAVGKHFISPAVQERLIGEALGTRDGASPLENLSNQELQVLRLIARGMRLGEIAAELDLSVKTIGTYCERLKNKLGVATARELSRKAASFLEERS